MVKTPTTRRPSSEPGRVPKEVTAAVKAEEPVVDDEPTPVVGTKRAAAKEAESAYVDPTATDAPSPYNSLAETPADDDYAPPSSYVNEASAYADPSPYAADPVSEVAGSQPDTTSYAPPSEYVSDYVEPPTEVAVQRPSTSDMGAVGAVGAEEFSPEPACERSSRPRRGSWSSFARDARPAPSSTRASRSAAPQPATCASPRAPLARPR